MTLSLKTSEFNIGGAVKWGIYGLILGLTLGLIFVTRLPSYRPWLVPLVTGTFIILFGLVGSKTKTKTQRELENASKFISNEGLTWSEIVFAVFLVVLNPILPLLFMYYPWRYKFPKKARQANYFACFVFGIYMLCFIVNVIAALHNFSTFMQKIRLENK